MTETPSDCSFAAIERSRSRHPPSPEIMIANSGPGGEAGISTSGSPEITGPAIGRDPPRFSRCGRSSAAMALLDCRLRRRPQSSPGYLRPLVHQCALARRHRQADRNQRSRSRLANATGHKDNRLQRAAAQMCRDTAAAAFLTLRLDQAKQRRQSSTPGLALMLPPPGRRLRQSRLRSASNR